jgi:hypothetical protein
LSRGRRAPCAAADPTRGPFADYAGAPSSWRPHLSWQILKVTLAHIRPAIWRRLAVPSDTALATLHDALQVAFGWEDSHLHEFRAGEVRYGVPDPDGVELLDEAEVTLAEVLPRKASRLEYIYDLGDY